MYLTDYTSDSFNENKCKSDLVIIPVGSLEAHGHHLPLGTDIFSPRLLCRMIDERIKEEVWIAPEIPYGQSYDLSIYPGTIHIPSEVLSQYAYHTAKSMFDNGFKKVMFLNGHGGNINALNLSCEKLMAIGMDAMVVNWWLDFSPEILKVTGGQGHAGEDETSAILYYDEKLVDMDKAVKNTRKPRIKVYYKNRGREFMKDAMTGDAFPASKEKGEKMFGLITDSMIEIINIFKSGQYYDE